MPIGPFYIITDKFGRKTRASDIDPKKSHGFTLMELMVAIGIVGVLTEIAVPNYIKYRQKGFIGAATGDLKKIQRKILDLGHDTGLWPNKRTAVQTTKAYQ